MNYALIKWKAEEDARIEAATQALLERKADREKRLSPAFETARFLGLSDDVPTSVKWEASIANFMGKDGKPFSLFVDKRNEEKLTKDDDYLVGFTPMLLDEHKSVTAMQFFLNAMMRPSPIMGEFVFARSPDSKRREQPRNGSNAGTTPSPHG